MVDVDILKDLIKQFMPFAQKHIGFENPPRLFLRSDPENAAKPLGKTAFYDPAKMCVTLYITDRHPKDVLRSLGHELVHHKQNCEGKFDNAGEMGEGYAQTNPHLRQMEIEANRDGSMCLRDFEDNLKKNNTIYFEHLQKGDKTMSTKDWKNQEIKSLLSEAWGFKMNLEQLNEGADLSGPEHEGNLEEDSTAELTEDSEGEETKHYGKDESADEREEDDLEHDEDRMRHHLDRIEHHLKKLRDDMGYDQSHEWSRHDESAETDVETIEEGDEELEERATRNPKPQRMHTDDDGERKLATESVEDKVRDMVRQMIKDSMK